MLFETNLSRKSRRFNKKRNAEINMTPLIDVMMSILVIFMVAAPLMTSGIPLNLPKVGGKTLEGQETSVNISIDKRGIYYIGEKNIALEKIVEKLTAIKQANKDISVTISGDTDTEYGRVIGLMAVLKEAGFERVGLKTEALPQTRKRKAKK